MAQIAARMACSRLVLLMLKKSVMHKHAVTMHKPLPDTVAFGSMFHGIIAKLRNAVRFDIPIGYQDEAGFHFGVKPVEKEIKWPSA
jgi:hypothetical protein